MAEPLSPARHLCRSSLGYVHYVEAGPRHAPTVVLLHQTPRSVDEFAEVVPLLARTHHVLGVDTPGYGCSDRLAEQPMIAHYADAVLAVLDAVRCSRAFIAGHHTGGVIAVELAAGAPERVAGIALSGPVYMDAAMRVSLAQHFAQWQVQADGSHLVDKWQKFMTWVDNPTLVQRLVTDLFSAGLASEFGHFAVAAYRMEDRLPLVSCPGLLIYGRRDSFASPAQAAPFRAVLRPIAEVMVDAGVFLPNEAPHAFADAVAAFAR